MQLHTLRQASLRSTDTLFRHAFFGTLVVALVLAAFVVFLLAAAASDRVPWWVATLFGALPALIAWVFGVTAWKSMLPTRWLLAADGTRVLLKFRSHLNPHFPADDPQVLELSADEILAVRRLDERTTTPGSGDEGKITNMQTALEIRVRPGVDLEPLARQLAHERSLARRGWGDYPVSLVGRDVVRVEWRSTRRRIFPGVDEALRVLGARVAGAAALTTDLSNAGGLPREEVERRVRALTERGDLLDAMRLASDGLGLELAEAKQMVERIQEGG